MYSREMEEEHIRSYLDFEPHEGSIVQHDCDPCFDIYYYHSLPDASYRASHGRPPATSNFKERDGVYSLPI